MIAADAADFRQMTEMGAAFSGKIPHKQLLPLQCACTCTCTLWFPHEPPRDMISADSGAPVRTPLSFLSASHEKLLTIRPGLGRREEEIM